MSIVVHCLSVCKYCDQAKEFLNNLHLPFQVIMYDKTADDYTEKKDKLVGQTNCFTFPQIFINNVFLGGYQDLISAHETLRLHTMCKEIGYEIKIDF